MPRTNTPPKHHLRLIGGPEPHRTEVELDGQMLGCVTRVNLIHGVKRDTPAVILTLHPDLVTVDLGVLPGAAEIVIGDVVYRRADLEPEPSADDPIDITTLESDEVIARIYANGEISRADALAEIEAREARETDDLIYQH